MCSSLTATLVGVPALGLKRLNDYGISNIRVVVRYSVKSQKHLLALTTIVYYVLSFGLLIMGMGMTEEMSNYIVDLADTREKL